MVCDGNYTKQWLIYGITIVNVNSLKAGLVRSLLAQFVSYAYSMYLDASAEMPSSSQPYPISTLHYVQVYTVL